MTDARVPERYLVDRRILRLTDSERSSYLMAALWSVSNRTDGRFERDDLPFIPTFKEASVPALVRTGLWVEDNGGWSDTEFAKVQTSKSDLEVLDNARRADREKKARQRAGKRATSTSNPGDGPGDVSRGQHRREIGESKERKGESDYESEEDEPVNNATGEVGWPTVEPGSGGAVVGGKCIGCGWPVEGVSCTRQHSEFQKEQIARARGVAA